VREGAGDQQLWRDRAPSGLVRLRAREQPCRRRSSASQDRDEDAEIRSSLEALPSPSQELTVTRIAKLRSGKTYVPALRSGFFEQTVRHLQAKTGMDDAYVARRLSEADPTLVDAARANGIKAGTWRSPFSIPMAIFAAADSDTSKGKRVEAAFGDLRTLIIAARAHNAKVAVVLLPPPVGVAKRYWGYFS
jgi:hypothetical protein